MDHRSADKFVIDPATGFRKTVLEHRPAALTASVSFAARLRLEDDHENPVHHRGINAGGGSAWWRCDPSLHAQAKPPVYMIAINEVSNQEGYAKEYVSPAQKSVKDHGGEYVAAGPGTQVAGNLPHGPVVILRWDSMEALQAWHNSPDFQAALKIGEKYAKFNIVAVNGLK
jgi:uncharacterized protein (DUF1330 family)